MKCAHIGLLGVITWLCACSDTGFRQMPQAGDTSTYRALVHRTEGGIPHIVAGDWASVGYGTAYAVAQDHLCEQSRNVLRLRGQLSAHFGPGEGHLESDLFYKLLQGTGIYAEPVDPEFDAMFTGYAAGFNRYVRDHGQAVTDPACADADWLPTMTVTDVRRMNLTPAFLPSFAPMILPAAPPADGVGSIEARQDEEAASLAAWVKSVVNPQDKGSNGVAIGGELSSDGSGLLFTNPHLHWTSFDFRMYGMHQIIPGVSNLLGANQTQRVNVGFGTNGDIAWTNTVSSAREYMFYQLELVPGNPLQYVFDGEHRDIEPVTVSVTVRAEDGSSREHSHTFYRSHFGWMIGGRFPWLNDRAYTLRIADEAARGFQGGALAMARATTVRQLKAAINKYQHTSGTNTIAADRGGEVLYGDLGPVLNFTDQQLRECVLSEPVFRGNSSACEWNTEADSAVPGLLGAARQPYLFRRDYVTNSNDSFWLANPEQPLTGYPAVQGDVGTERRMRTRSGLAMVQARQRGADGLPGNRFNLDSLAERMLSNQNMAARLLVDDLVTLCRRNPSVELENGPVDMREACEVLHNWDRHNNLDSRGAHLFREFLRAARTATDGKGSIPGTLRVAIPFDPQLPLQTPAGLDTTANPAALRSLAQAVQLLREAGIALDAPLGELQGVTRNGEFIPLPGGDDFEGIFNKMGMDFAGPAGYPEVTGSSASWVMVTQVAGEDTRARGLTSYSQSSDPTSPHYADLTKRFSRGQLVELPFSLAAVEAAALSTLALREGVDDCAADGWRAFSHLGASDEQSCRDYFEAARAARLTDYVDD